MLIIISHITKAEKPCSSLISNIFFSLCGAIGYSKTIRTLLETVSTFTRESVNDDAGKGRVQGWRSGESTRLPPMWPGFDSKIRRQMWAEFVGSLLCTERFSPGTPVSPLLKRPPFDLICVNC